MFENIELKIAELIKKADSAQRAGNYEAMEEYDRQIRILQKAQMEMFKSVINSEKEENKPKVK